MKFFKQHYVATNFSKIKRFLKLQYILPILFATLPSIAFATSSLVGTIPDGDVSMKVLGALFAGLTDSVGGDPMLSAIKIFNGGILIIGGILAAYTILAGTLGTAHDGEMLGKKFSSVGIPIRYSLGTALVLPVVGGGYCVMQAIVMWLIIQGVGLADTAWSAYTANPTSTANTSESTVSTKNIQEVAKNAFKSSICYQSYAKAIQESDSILKWGKYTYSMIKQPYGYSYGDSSSSLRTSGCGNVLYPNYYKLDLGQSASINLSPTDTVVSNSTPSTNPGYLGNLDTIFKPMDMTAINTAHNLQTDILVKSMDALATKVIANPDMTPAEANAFYSEFQKAADVYSAGIKSAVTSTAATSNGFQEIQKTASEQGWILAGTWFRRIIQMNESIQAAVNSTPTAHPYSPAGDAFIFSDAAKYLKTADLVLATEPGKTPTDTYGSEDNSSQEQTAAKGESHDSSGLMLQFEASITESLTGMNLIELKNDTRHPLIIVSDLGANIVSGTLQLMLQLAIVAGAVATIPFVGNAVLAALTVVKLFVGLPISAMIGVALATQYIIPNLPYIIWVGAIVGWMLLVVEAIIAAPLWAIMHLHPNGDDLTGRGGNGYMLVLSLLLRPVLMVFGMLAAIIISAVAGELINKTFYEVFMTNVGATGWSEMLALFIGTGLYFIVMFTFVKKCFGIIHQLPDQLLKWIGGGDNALGQFAGEFGGTAEKASQQASAVGGAMGGRALGIAQEKGEAKLGQINKEMGSKEGSSNSGISGFLGRNMSAIGGGPSSGNGIQGSDGKIRNSAGGFSFSEMQSQQSNANYDAKFGEGASALKRNLGSSFSGGERSAFNQSFDQGISSAISLGGSAGAQEFMAKASTAVAEFGGDSGAVSEANNSAVSSIAENAVTSKGYSSEVAKAVVNMAKTSSGGVDAPTVKNSIEAMDDVKSSKGLWVVEEYISEVKTKEDFSVAFSNKK